MGKITKLSESLANRIAAGEVVERPASVAKELLENAIDASARSVELSVAEGGLSLIQVMDDGEGMSPEDAELCLERHATSKITGPADLDAIGTLGFRGEALPSIASVSRMALRTRTSDAPAGLEIRVSGGKRDGVHAVGMPQGTLVEVRDLFFNAPARRKFLKARSAELREVGRIASVYALAYPEIAMAFTADGKERFRFSAQASVRDRVRVLRGRETAESLLPVDGEREGLLVHGVISSPDQCRGNNWYGILLLNGRPIRDRGLARAILDGYGGRIPRNRYPLYVLNIEIPLDKVDVNVHPAKHEVRLRDGGALYGLILESVRSAVAGTPGETVGFPVSCPRVPAFRESEGPRREFDG